MIWPKIYVGRHYSHFFTKYKKIILLSGVNRSTHLEDDNSEHNLNSRNNLLKSLNKILSIKNNIYVYLDIPDIHICIMRLCKNLLVHKGGYSIIGSLINKNNVFYTNELQCIGNMNWFNEINKKNAKKLN